MIKRVSLLLCFITAVSALQASPIAYNILFNFTNGEGDTLPTGSFTYDSSLAVNPFSVFTVTAGGVLFDLTSSANGFTGDSSVGACKSSQSAAGFFNGLTGAGCKAFWDYEPGEIDFFFPSSFGISVCSLSGDICSDGKVSDVVFAQGTGSRSAGLLTVTAAAATPEPGALWLSGIGVLAFMSRGRILRRKRNA